jgi:hypothetical protein
MLEIELCLRGNKSKSCGSDKIPFIFLQNLPSSGKVLLLRLYNLIWETGLIPIKWKNAIITPIPKIIKTASNLQDIDQYRYSVA